MKRISNLFVALLIYSTHSRILIQSDNIGDIMDWVGDIGIDTTSRVFAGAA